MAYTDTRNTSARAPAIIGVAAIHAAIGVVLVTGLGTVIKDQLDPPPFVVRDIPIEVPPPPKPDVPPKTKPDTPTTRQVVTPLPPFDLNPMPVEIETTDLIPPPSPGPIIDVGPRPGPAATPSPMPSKLFEPVAPRARNSGWVTDSDYRTVWINREWEGTAGFRLDIGTSGRVENCTITRSTGHSALDRATCKLVTRRARFEAARNDQGDVVNGTFSSAVRWQIPD